MKKITTIIFITVLILFAPLVKAQTIDATATSNQQLALLLQQLITVLIQRVEELQRQLAVQQQAINRLSNQLPQTIFVQPMAQTQQGVQNQVANVSSTQSMPNNTLKADFEKTCELYGPNIYGADGLGRYCLRNNGDIMRESHGGAQE